MCVDPDGPAPDQVAYDQAVTYNQPVFFCKLWSPEQERLGFIIRVLNRLGFIQRDTPRALKTSLSFPTSLTSSWGVIDLAQLEACIKEELSK